MTDYLSPSLGLTRELANQFVACPNVHAVARLGPRRAARLTRYLEPSQHSHSLPGN